MKTLEHTKKRIVKTVEVKYSNMTFVLTARCHYMAALNNPGWSRTLFTAKIKETGESIGILGNAYLIRSQLSLINSRPDLFLHK